MGPDKIISRVDSEVKVDRVPSKRLTKMSRDGSNTIPTKGRKELHYYSVSQNA